jgi:hypothetical protein
MTVEINVVGKALWGGPYQNKGPSRGRAEGCLHSGNALPLRALHHIITGAGFFGVSPGQQVGILWVSWEKKTKKSRAFCVLKCPAFNAPVIAGNNCSCSYTKKISGGLLHVVCTPPWSLKLFMNVHLTSNHP